MDSSSEVESSQHDAPNSSAWQENNDPIVKSTDMPDVMQQHAIQCTQKAIEAAKEEGQAATTADGDAPTSKQRYHQANMHTDAPRPHLYFDSFSCAASFCPQAARRASFTTTLLGRSRRSSMPPSAASGTASSAETSAPSSCTRVERSSTSTSVRRRCCCSSRDRRRSRERRVETSTHSHRRQTPRQSQRPRTQIVHTHTDVHHPCTRTCTSPSRHAARAMEAFSDSERTDHRRLV